MCVRVCSLCEHAYDSVMGMGVCTCMCAPVCTCVVWVDKYKWTHVCYWPEAPSLLILGGPAGHGYDSCLAGQSRRQACAGLTQMPNASRSRDRASWLCTSRLVREGSVGGQPQALGVRTCH